MKSTEAPVYIRHWIIIIIGVFMILVARHLQKASRAKSVPARSIRNTGDTRFVAIYYPRISKRPESGSMSKKLFSQHMNMLKEEGYCSMGLQRVRDFYYEGGLLPEKAVVILLDGFRDTCINAIPVIEKLGLEATMMLNVGAMRMNDRSFMSWHDLKKMQREQSWDFGVTTGGNGNPQKQLEYLKGRFADIGVCGISAPVDPNDSVAFAREKMLLFPRRNGDGYNSINTDPSCLKVLRAKPQQGHDELTQLLSNVFSRASRFEDEFVEDTMHLSWNSVYGGTTIRNGVLELSAGPSHGSADVWLAGTYDWSDVDLAARFKVVSGKQFWAYVRFRNEGNYVRLGCDANRLFLQQKVADAKVRNLKVFEFENDFSKFHNLRLITRGHHAIAYLDGQKLSERPLRVDDSLILGKVGFAVWDPSCGVANSQIDSVSIQALPCIALMDTNRYESTSSCIAEYSDYLSYLCPDWSGLDNMHAERNTEDYRALLISAAYGGHKLTPTIVLEDNDFRSSNPGVLVNKLTRFVGENRFGGLHIDCRRYQHNESLEALAEMLAALKAKSPEFALILSVPPRCYQTCEELLRAADVLVLQLASRQCDLLDKIARPLRLKMLLRVETDEPQAFIGSLVSAEDAERAIDSVNNAINIIQNYELKGIALCGR